MTFGVIVGNRGFFPDELARQGRQNIIQILEQKGFNAILLDPEVSKHGAVETFSEAKKCASLFNKHADSIDGIIVTLPNFGDEKGVTESIKRSGLKVPVLIQAEPDNSVKMKISNRRDSFCGKISVCNNLKQSGIPFTLTTSHTESVKSQQFGHDLENFAATCHVTAGLKEARLGAIGARTGAFNTVRYSEKLLEKSGISVETIDLSEIFGRVDRLKDDNQAVKDKLQQVKAYVDTRTIPAEKLLKMAQFGHVVDQWVEEVEVVGTAIQCWTSMEEFFGIVPCGLMSMMSEALLPSACEVDITGLVGMYILQLASGSPSALLDWNNNFGDAADKCVLFHCSNLPRSFFETVKMDYQEIIAGSVGQENTFGTVVGRIAPNPATFLRVTTDDSSGRIRAYVGEGAFTSDTLETFGGYGVIQINNLNDLMAHICRYGYEHHVAVNITRAAAAIEEALGNYLGWDIYRHR